jgi:hypothetical protein
MKNSQESFRFQALIALLCHIFYFSRIFCSDFVPNVIWCMQSKQL